MHITIQQINFLRFFCTQKSVKYLRRVIIRWYTCTYTIFSVWNTASVHRKIMFISSTIFRLNLSKDYIRCQSYVLFITPTAITTSILACLKTNLGEKNWDQWGRETIAYLHEEQFTSQYSYLIFLHSPSQGLIKPLYTYLLLVQCSTWWFKRNGIYTFVF